MAKEDKKGKKGKVKKDPSNPYGNYKFNRDIKVSQSSVDKIKDVARKEGIEAAIKRFGKSDAEAVKRLYGQRRYDLYAPKGSASGRPGPNAGSASSAGARRSSPVKMGGGQGYKAAAKKKPMNRGAAIAAGAGAAGSAAALRSMAIKHQKLTKLQTALNEKQKKIDAMKPGKVKTAAIESRQKALAQYNQRIKAMEKFAKSPAGKVIGKLSRAATSRTAVGAAAIYGGTKYAQMLRAAAAKTEARRKAGQTDKSAGGARATAIKKSRGR